MDQDPGMWETVASDTRKTLHIRYRLLPYLYTLFHQVHTSGGTVVRSLMFEYTDDKDTYGINDQFLWGAAFMISPVLEENTTSIEAYFPQDRWFDYYTGEEVPVRGDWLTLDAPIDHINLHVRGGYILPTQHPAISTVWSRDNPMGLIVALSDTGTASGDLFWDDGESLETQENGLYFYGTFNVDAGSLTNTIVTDGFGDVAFLAYDDIEILGAGPVTTVTINGVQHIDWIQDSITMVYLVIKKNNCQ